MLKIFDAMKKFLMLFIPNPQKDTKRGEGETRYRLRKHKFQVAQFLFKFCINFLYLCLSPVVATLGQEGMEEKGKIRKKRKKEESCQHWSKPNCMSLTISVF